MLHDQERVQTGNSKNGRSVSKVTEQLHMATNNTLEYYVVVIVKITD